MLFYYLNLFKEDIGFLDILDNTFQSMLGTFLV